MGVKNLGHNPYYNGSPWNIYKGFPMDYATGVFPGAQEVWRSPRGGHQIKVGDKTAKVWCDSSEYNSIFGYQHAWVIPNLKANNQNAGGMFKGNGMNVYLEDFYNSDKNSHNYVWSFGSNNAGNPIPIGGMTFDIFCHHEAWKKDGSKLSGSNDDKNHDIQLNEIWGCYLNPNDGSFISLKFLPEGDNWGGSAASVTTKSKYYFRNNNSDGTDLSPDTHRVKKKSGSHFLQNKNQIHTITVVRAAAESVPSGYLFCGFDMSAWIGRAQNEVTGSKIKILNISNLRLHDEKSVKAWHSAGRNYGNESYVGNHLSLIPYMKNKSNSTRTSPWRIELDS